MSDSIDRVRERAVAFVRAQGDAFGRRAAPVLAGAEAVGALEDWLAQDQPPSQGTVASLRRSVGVLVDAGTSETPLVEGACRRLEEIQAPEGFWDAGDVEDTIRETGLLVGLLARSPFARADALDAAADWLAGGFSPDRVQGFAWDAIAGYAACFANLPHEEADGILQWCGRELQRGHQARRFDAIRTARVLAWCDAPSIPGAALTAGELVQAILTGQAADGSWAPPDGVAPVAHALDALAVLRRFA